MSTPENPPAFPCTGEGYGSPLYTQKGMTLRDWFAGQALASCAGKDFSYEGRLIAERSYKIADAMLAERERGA